MSYLKISNRGNSITEIASVVIFILAVMVAFGPYIQRGVAGHGKALGDSLGQGRQYDPRAFGAVGEGGGTMDCFRDDTLGDATYSRWVDAKCYQASNCDCTFRTFDGQKLPEYADRCENCKAACEVSDSRCQ